MNPLRNSLYLKCFSLRELVSTLASRGVAVYLISGGFHSIVDHVANQLGIPLERVFANRLQFDEQGKGLFAYTSLLCLSLQIC